MGADPFAAVAADSPVHRRPPAAGEDRSFVIPERANAPGVLQDSGDEFHALARRLIDEYDRVSSELLRWRGRDGARGASPAIQIAAGAEQVPITRQCRDVATAPDSDLDCLAQAGGLSTSTVGFPGAVTEALSFASEQSGTSSERLSPSKETAQAHAGEVEVQTSSPALPVKSASDRLRRTTRRASQSKSFSFAGTFALDPIWLQQDSGYIRGMSFRSQDDDDTDASATTQYYNGALRRLITQPSNPKLIAWDLIGGVLIFYDLFAIPLGAFPYPRGTFTDVTSWITLVFWSLNMLSSLCVGYVDNGVIIMNPRQIAVHYLKSWFVVDVAVVIPDSVFSIAALVGDNDSSGATVRLLRILRLVRMTRLVRLLKLRRLIQKLHDMVDSEYLSIFMNILKMILILLVTNHVIACLWFLVGSQNASISWIMHHGFADEDWGHQYAVAYHWSITQFTPASMHVQPQSVAERVFAISIVVFALVGFAYVIGSITGSLTQLRQMQEEATKQFWNLRRYMKHKRIPIELGSRIQCYLEHAWECEQRVQNEKKVRILSLLSEQLHSELQYTLYAKDLNIHPLFGELTKVSNVSVHRLSHKAMTVRHLARRDPVFVYQEKSTHMYLVLAGQLRYAHAKTEVREIVEEHEDWISEASLWMTKWVHLGNLSAVTESNLLLVSPKIFAEIVQKNPHAYSLASTYARNFLQWLNDLSAEELSDIFQGEIVSERHLEFCEVDNMSDYETTSPAGKWKWHTQMTRSVTRMVHAGTRLF